MFVFDASRIRPLVDRGERFAFFKNGTLDAVLPSAGISVFDDLETAYHADFFVIDGVVYDLSNAEDVCRIPPKNHGALDSVVLNLSYILKIHTTSLAASADLDLVGATVRLAFEAMRVSGLLWTKKDYLRLVRCFYQTGYFEEGDTFEHLIRREYPSLFEPVSSFPGDALLDPEHRKLAKARRIEKSRQDESLHEREKRRLLEKWKGVC